MKKLLIVAAATFMYISAFAQLKVGSNPTTTSSTVNLEVEATNGTKVIVEKATGKVGIGTTDPKNCLHILCEPTATSNITTSYVKGMTLTGKGGAGYTGPGFYLENTDNPSGKKLFKINYTANGGSEGYINFQSVSDDASASVAGEIMAITHSGNVGIGTAVPNARLHLAGNRGAINTILEGRMSVKGVNPGIFFDSLAVGANAGVQKAFLGWEPTFPNHALGVWNPTTGWSFNILQNGNVGIGTSAPNAQLQLGNTAANRKIVLWESANNNHQFYGLGIGSGTMNYQVDGPTSSHVFYAASSSSASNELMRIVGNGNIGVGTTSPATKLHVAGVTGGSVARIEHAGGGGNTGDALQAGINNCGGPCGQGTGRNLVMYNANGSNSNFASLDFVPNSDPSSISGASIQGIDRDATNNYAGLNFMTRNATDFASRMVIKSSGNVGIGTTTPTANLHVVGTVKMPTVATATVAGPYNALGINTTTGDVGTFTSGAAPIFSISTATASPTLNNTNTTSSRIPLTTAPTIHINTLGIVTGQDAGLTLSDGTTSATMDYFQVPSTGIYRFELNGTCGCSSAAANGVGNYMGYNVNLWKAASGSTSYSIIDDFRALVITTNTGLVAPITPASFILNLTAGDKVCFRFYVATGSSGNSGCGFTVPANGNQSFSARATITKI